MQQCVLDFDKLEYQHFSNIKDLWIAIRFVYFPERNDLDKYLVVWSKRRQRRVLATCNVTAQKVIVAQELNDPRFHKWVQPILYHEMCHAFFGKDVPRENGRRAWHGKEFRKLERRHPQIPELDYWIKSGGWKFAVHSHRSRINAKQKRVTRLFR